MTVTLTLLTGIAHLHSKTERLLIRTQQALHNTVSETLVHGLTTHEQTALSLSIYQRRAGTYTAEQGLFDWEKRWYQKRLPNNGARIFLGGAGAGREVRALLRMGYRLDASEPCVALAKYCEGVLTGKGAVIRAPYELLSTAILEEPSVLQGFFSGKKYGGVILGWGSFSHVLTEAEQFRLLKASDKLTPEGPILLSYWQSPLNGRHPTPLSSRLGRRLGRGLARFRRLNQAYDSQRSFHGLCGFVRYVSREQLEAYADTLGRDITFEDSAEYAHATLTPRRSAHTMR